jgi:hypothetical protein
MIATAAARSCAEVARAGSGPSIESMTVRRYPSSRRSSAPAARRISSSNTAIKRSRARTRRRSDGVSIGRKIPTTEKSLSSTSKSPAISTMRSRVSVSPHTKRQVISSTSSLHSRSASS